MITNILEYLELSAGQYPDKTAYFDERFSYSYGDILTDARAIGTALASEQKTHAPVMVYMEKSPLCMAAFWGVLYSRNFYVPTDTKMPEYRLQLIKDNLQPYAIITDEANQETANRLFGDCKVLLFSKLIQTLPDETLLMQIRKSVLDTDPIYVLYTSGSTGVPKGVVVCHRSLIDYVEHFCEEVDITEQDVIANQAPFYFDASLIDIYCTLKSSATMGIVPPDYFTIPIKLLEFMQEHRITTIRWVPSAMKMISTLRGFKTLKPAYLRKIIFGAEAMPTKCYNYWKDNYPEAVFVQIYGPTEITGVCTYYIVDREYANDETIPIGRAFGNTEVFLLDEQDQLITAVDVIGEICVKGTCLAHGYYNAPEKTREVFTQNPLQEHYPELIYRTGDLAQYNERGELIFSSRKDSQIKHMGHRIELGEIEAVVNSLPGIRAACCLFHKEKEKIVLFYETDAYEDVTLIEALQEKLLKYMMPNVLHKLDKIPQTQNGKVDRMKLKEQYIEGGK